MILDKSYNLPGPKFSYPISGDLTKESLKSFSALIMKSPASEGHSDRRVLGGTKPVQEHRR